MANRIAIAYPDQATAEEVLTTLSRLQAEKTIELEDAVIVTRKRRTRSCPRSRASAAK